MIRRKITLILVILAIFLTAVTGFKSVTARSEDGTPYELSVSGCDSEEERPYKPESLFTIVRDNGDGTKTLELHGDPVRYVSPDGTLKDISLEPVEKGKGFSSGDHFIYAEFPQKIESGVLLDTGEFEITVKPVNEDGFPVTSAPASLSEESIIVYRRNETESYEYNLTYSGYKETIVISEYTGKSEWYFRIFTDGLALSESDVNSPDGSGLVLTGIEGNIVASFCDIIAFSADERNNTLGSITCETVEERSEYIICVSVPKAYLTDPATKYPVSIDPTLVVSYANNGAGAIQDYSVCDQLSYSGDATFLFAGKNSYGAIHRCFFNFPYLSLSGKNITYAALCVRDLLCESQSIPIECREYVGTQWTESGGLSWAIASAGIGDLLDTRNIYYGNGNVSGASHWYAFDITGLAQDWADGLSSPASGVLLKSSASYENGNVSGYKTLGSYNRPQNKPYLTVTYTEITGEVTLSQSSATIVAGNTLQLSASTVPTGLTVEWSSSNNNVATVTSSGLVTGVGTGTATIYAECPGDSASCTVYVVALADGVYRIQNFDNSKYLTDTGDFDVSLSTLSGSSRGSKAN